MKLVKEYHKIARMARKIFDIFSVLLRWFPNTFSRVYTIANR